MKQIIVIIVLVAALAASLYFNFKGSEDSSKFKGEMALLEAKNDSLKEELVIADTTIARLNEQVFGLDIALSDQKAKVITITKVIEVDKHKIDNLSKKQLVEFFNARYSKDTTTELLPLAQPVLIATAKDLVEFDATKKIVAIQDSTIILQDAKLAVKENIITEHLKKEDLYKKSILNQEAQTSGWKGEFLKVESENKKLKSRNKFLKIATGVAAGGLIYMIGTR